MQAIRAKFNFYTLKCILIYRFENETGAKVMDLWVAGLAEKPSGAAKV